MVEPIKLYSYNTSKINFGSENQEPKETPAAAQAPQETAREEKPTVVDTAKKVRGGFLNFLKDVNEVTNITAGAVRGAAEGVTAAGIIGLVGVSIKKAKGDIAGTIKNVFSDLFRIQKENNGAVWKFFGFFPKLLTKSPIDNVKTIAKLPVNFYGKYLKGHPATAVAATVAGAGILLARTLQGRLKANKANSDVDHYTTRRGH